MSVATGDGFWRGVREVSSARLLPCFRTGFVSTLRLDARPFPHTLKNSILAGKDLPAPCLSVVPRGRPHKVQARATSAHTAMSEKERRGQVRSQRVEDLCVIASRMLIVSLNV